MNSEFDLSDAGLFEGVCSAVDMCSVGQGVQLRSAAFSCGPLRASCRCEQLCVSCTTWLLTAQTSSDRLQWITEERTSSGRLQHTS